VAGSKAWQTGLRPARQPGARPSSLGPLRLRLCGALGSSLAIRLVEQDECRCSTRGVDRVGRIGFLSSLDVECGDVDDSRELADVVAKKREIVVGPFELGRNGPLGGQLLGDRPSRLAALCG